MMLVITYYAEQVRPGYSIMRRDVVVDGSLVPELSGTDGSPAPTETVKRYERIYRSES
jgi:hypothetical protein